MTVSRYGHLWSAPVVVDVGVRTEWETSSPCLSPRALFGRLLEGLLPLQRRADVSALPLTTHERESPEVRERCSAKSAHKLSRRSRSLPYGQQRVQEFLLWPLQAVRVTDHGQRSAPAFGLSWSLCHPPLRVAQNVSRGQ